MRKSFWKTTTFHYLLMLLPAVALALVFSIAPLTGIIMAFQDFNPGKGMFRSEFIGLDNFRDLLVDPQIYQIIKNTVYISLMKMAAGIIVPIVFALLLNELRVRFFKRTVQTIVYLPHFLSWVIIAGIIKDMFAKDGVINMMLGSIGIEAVSFLGSNFWFRPLLVTTDVWKEFGFAAVVYLAALTSISPSLYEAADMDGATRLQKLRHVTIPGITTTIVLLGTLSLQNVLNAGFDQVFNLYNDLVFASGDIIDTYVYRVGFQQINFEIGTAVGLFKSVISMFLIVGAYKLADRFAGYRIF
ncbi:sugar ABC transporter permease [Paenibacillus albicereus]|uniref:Sugar ABC transporter permease n=1 Tax=Paenibacillus albicereus TaxID=2726185 RepID=A0A6H2GVT2_9BACL|nr:ABC transporter permease subunit [Paenibacillus albicereus]QJC51517.1 sugar ABC transporter permease [Paenibacillus albicereus]